ncbi:MAG TPA: DUF6632 domain-containing protein [Gemmatimonadales bacterium]|jgi:hypothetical protein
MTAATRITSLRYVMIATGAIFAFGIYPLTQLWPAGWVWNAGQPSHYRMMIIGVYFVLGLCLLAASREPLANRSLIWFTVWSSVLHSVVMAVEAGMDPLERGHLIGDVPALLLVGIALAALTPRAATVTVSPSVGARRAA